MNLKLQTTFKCTYLENAERIVMAMAFAGLFPQIKNDNPGYIIDVYARDYNDVKVIKK